MEPLNFDTGGFLNPNQEDQIDQDAMDNELEDRADERRKYSDDF